MVERDEVVVPVARSRWRRWLRALAWAAGGVVILCVVSMLALLYSSTVAGLVVSRAVGFYADAIPGDASVGRVEGRIGGDLVLHGVRLVDREGASLVEIDRLRVGVRPWAALARRLDLGRIELEGVRVWLPPEDAPGFADLAPPSEDEEPVESDGLGPDLPLRIDAMLALHDFVLLDGGTQAEMASIGELDLEVWAQGRRAETTLRLDAAVPLIELEELQLGLHAAWDEPEVRLDDLELRTSWGSAELLSAQLDVEAMRGALEPLIVEPDPRWIEAELGVRPEAPWRITLHGSGDLSEVDVELEVDAPELLVARTRISGRPTPPLDTTLELVVTPGATLLRQLTDASPLELLVSATITGDPQAELSARLALHCPGCDLQGAPVTLVASARGAPADPRGRVEARFAGGGLGVWLDAALESTGRYQATAGLAAPDLGRLASIVNRVAEAPDLAGAAEAQLDCSGTIDPLTAACGVEVGVRQGRPVRSADIALRVELADAIELVADRLELDAPPVRIGLAASNPRVVIADERVQIDDVDLRVAVARAVGRVTASGRLDASGSHALDVGVRGLDLAGLDSFVPGLGVRGRVDLDARLEGTTTEPRLDAQIVGRSLGWHATDLGTLRLDLGYGEGRGRVAVRSPTGPLQGMRFDANVPVALPGEGVAGGLRGDAPARANLDLHGLDLAVAAAFAPSPLALAGSLDLEASLAGTLARPRLSLTLTGRGLAYDDAPLGDVRAELSYARSSAQARVELEHPSVRKARVELESSLTLDLASPRVAWAPGSPHRAHLQIEQAKLEALSRWLPEPALAGTLDLDVRLAEDLVAPTIDVGLAVRDLDVAGRRVGSLEAEAGYADGVASLRATGQGPALEGLGVTARVPIRLSPGTGRAQWSADEPHELDVSLVGVHLDEAVAWLPGPIDVEGRGDTHVRLRGTASAPRAEVFLAFGDLRYGGRDVGDVELEAAFADERASADLRVRRDVSRHLEASAAVPLRVDVGRGDVAWLSDRPHSLHVEAPRIDPELLLPFVELPESLDFALALHADGRGDLAEPTLDVQLGGHIELEGSPRQPFATTVTVGGSSQRAKLTLGDDAHPLLVVDGRSKLPLAALARGEVDVATTPLHVDVRADDVDLSLAGGLAPELVANPTGRVDLRASVGGTVGAPKLDGSLGVRNAALTVVPLRQRFEAFTLDVSLANERIELSTLSARSGRGSLHARGRMDLGEQGIVGELELRGSRVPLRKPGLPHMELSTQVRTSLSMQGERTRIGIDVRDTRVDVALSQTAAAKAIPTSARVHYVEFDDRRPAERTETLESVDAEAGGPSRPMDLLLRLSDPVRITGPAVDMAWGGTLRAAIEGEDVVADGAIQTQDGYFDLFGNQFRIEEGSVSIPKGRDHEPFVDLTATTQVAEVQITAHVRGRVSRPELIFSSTPAMTQSQIFTMLLTGSPDVDSADSGDVEARAASLLAAFSNPALQRQLNERLGVDRIGVGFGERTDQPILSVGKYLGKKVYVETQYQHNAAPTDNRAQLMMRYRLAPRWSLETVFGDAAAGGIDLFWGRAFDMRRRKSK